MSITIHNYEAYLLDYMEGNLDVTKEKELHEFLSLHPELNPGENIQLSTIAPENIVFSNKNSLKKFDFTQKITEFNFDDFCIAYYEGILPSDQETRLNHYCLKHNKEKDFEFYGKTYLKPDPSSFFKNKNALYRKNHSKEIRFIILQVSAVAASIALLLTILKPLGNENKILPIPEVKETALIYFHAKSDAANTTLTKKTVIKATERVEKQISNMINRQEEELKPVNSLPVQLATIPEGQLIFDYADQVKGTEIRKKEKGVITFISETLSEIKTKEVKLENIKKPKVSLVHLFKAGINGISSVTDSNMKFSEQTDSSGNITVVSFESSLIKYHHYRNN